MKEFYIVQGRSSMRVCKHYLNLQVGALLGVPIIIKCANFLILMCDLLQRHIYQQIVRELLSIWNTG
jgi:hypothetical protein